MAIISLNAIHALGIHHKINHHYIDRLKPRILNKMQFECRFNLNNEQFQYPQFGF